MIRGNWSAGIARLVARANDFASGKVVRELLEVAADKILEAQQRELVDGMAPDGSRYPSPKAGGTPMRKSGALLRSAKAVVSGGKVTITFDAPYAGILHRKGRRLVPRGPELGKVWGPQVLPAMRRALAQALAGGA